MDDSSGPGRLALASRLGPVLAALVVLLDGIGLAVHLTTPAAGRTTLFDTPEPIVGPALALVAAVLTSRPAARRMGWVLLGVGAAACTFTAARAVTARTWADGEPGWLGQTSAWLTTWVWVWGFLPFVLLLPLLFPTGAPPSARWRPVAAASIALTTGVSVVLALDPRVDSVSGARNPLGTDLLEPLYPGLAVVAAVAFPVLALLGLASVVVRARAGGPVERRQLALFGWAVLMAALSSFLLPGATTAAASLLVPGAVLVAVLRYRLYEVDVLVSRTVVGAALLGGGLVLYLGIAAWVGTAVGESSAALAGAAALALAFHPARVSLQRAVDRLLFGDRGDPYRLLTRVDDAVGGAATPLEALERAVAAAAEALRLPALCAEVELPGGGVARAGCGDAAPVLVVPVVAHGVQVGRLLAASRGRADRLDRTDERRLAEVAAALSGVASALRLAQDVEKSREQTVAAREEERRRLRRDLHDGLGPQLAAVIMTVDSVRSALPPGDRVRAVLEVALAEAQRAVADVRQLVHGLRPPALDDLGLVAALRSTGPAAGGLDVTVTAEDLDELPAAVEVAAFRIAQEALTNVVRHAGTDSARVALRAAEGVLWLSIADAGRGVADGRVAGVGLASMRERAAEVGGSVTWAPAVGGGTVVTARLPLVPAQRGLA